MRYIIPSMQMYQFVLVDKLLGPNFSLSKTVFDEDGTAWSPWPGLVLSIVPPGLSPHEC